MRIIALLFLFATRISLAQASIFEWSKCVSSRDLRTGNIAFTDIPCIIISVADTLLSFVGTISLGVILVGALMYIFWGVNEEFKSKGKTTVKLALMGAIISWSSWLIVNFIIDNL